MIDEKKVISWESLIRKCPHCGNPLTIHHVSTISQKHLIEMLYNSLEKHSLECINHDTKKIITVEMEISSDIGQYGAKLVNYEWFKLIV